MSDQPPQRRRPSGVVPAIQDLTDDVVTLIRQYLDLARAEAKAEAAFLIRHIIMVAFFGSLALAGYILLNVATVLFAGLIFGMVTMASTALILAAVNLSAAFFGIGRVMKRLKSREIGLEQTTAELERSREWVKKIQE